MNYSEIGDSHLFFVPIPVLFSLSSVFAPGELERASLSPHDIIHQIRTNYSTIFGTPSQHGASRPGKKVPHCLFGPRPTRGVSTMPYKSCCFF
jgi:hypothetical protein